MHGAGRAVSQTHALNFFTEFIVKRTGNMVTTTKTRDGSKNGKKNACYLFWQLKCLGWSNQSSLGHHQHYYHIHIIDSHRPSLPRLTWRPVQLLLIHNV